MDDTGAVIQYSLSLPGGVAVTVKPTGELWSYGDLHGNTIITTDENGTRQGARTAFDPFGQPIMVNVFGADGVAPMGSRYARVLGEHPLAKVHNYGKQPRPGRKLGHVTVTGENLDDVAYEARAAAALFG